MVVLGVVGIEPRPVGSRETVEFRQQVCGSQDPSRYWSNSMSVGALRVVAVLAAVFQGAGNSRSSRRFFGIEKPQAVVHPTTARVLFDAPRDGSEYSQILVTSNSPDLLDNDEISADSIFVAVAEEGTSLIGPLGPFGRSVLGDHLCTAGELLRLKFHG